ncbi:MAG TPA: serine/threonine-protein kinase [Planctomycetota bacterium]|nr:serine/threonine-protein kinase [Planctomycetota bacterium]
MADTIPMGPDDNPQGGDATISDSTRKCLKCGESYTGALHFACLAGNSTIRDADRPDAGSASPPDDPGFSKGTLDDFPDEAAVHAADVNRQLNHYVLVRQIGRGGMGTVWKAWDKKLTRWVAIKFLLSEDPEGVDRFGREAKLAARLRHPNIAAIYEVGDAPSREAGQARRHYLAMEYIDGHTLAEAKLPRAQLLDVFIKVAGAIDAAHKGGVVHRDLKPPNIMVTQEHWPYVMDFGVAKGLALDSSLSGSGLVVGTPAYMPPEQAEGRSSAIDARSDVYSLGATMYALLLGRPPFDGESVMEVIRKVSTEPLVPPRQIDPAFPADLEAILLRAMAKSQKDRYPTAAALANDLALHRDGRRPESPSAPAVLPAPSPTRSGGGVAIVGVAALLLLGGLAAVVAPHFLSGGPRPAPPVSTNPDPPRVPPPAVPEPAPDPTPPAPPPKETPVETGVFTLKIAVHPFAQIVSLTRDGEPVTLDGTTTPRVLTDLRVGTYDVLLRHPQFGDRTVSLPRSRIQAGKTYVVWGQMGKPALDVTELP